MRHGGDSHMRLGWRGGDSRVSCNEVREPPTLDRENTASPHPSREAAVVVRDAGGKGLGVFSTEALEAGRWVCQYKGKLVVDLEEKAPFDPLGLLPTTAALTDEGLPAADPASDYLLSLCPGLMLDAAETTHFSRYLNHDEHANLKVVTCMMERRADVYAATRIKAGDEMCLDYGEGYWYASRTKHGEEGSRTPLPGTDSRDSVQTVVDSATPFLDWYEKRAIADTGTN